MIFNINLLISSMHMNKAWKKARQLRGTAIFHSIVEEGFIEKITFD